ncbi:MAG: hypothetical protein AAFU71_07770 [Cyanobacteria bacterium J06632_22]
MTELPASGRRFELADAIAREGRTFLKGDDAIPRPLRAMAQVNQIIINGLHDPGGALKTTLQNWVRDDLRISQHLDQPLIALALILADLTARPQTFYEFSRQVSMTWGQLTGDLPHFQKPGHPPHADAEYTHAQIRTALQQLLHQLETAQMMLENPAETPEGPQPPQ